MSLEKTPTTANEHYFRDHFTCIYCGFDGRSFEGWMQLSTDHIRPKSNNGSDDLSNRAVACHSCNCITSRMKFPEHLSREEIIFEKRAYVAKSRANFYELWMKTVAPNFLKRPPPNIDTKPFAGEVPPQPKNDGGCG